jgi:type VI secretion system protein ImpE
MGPQALFQAGKLNEATAALGAEVRDNPTDAKRRTFLFELLCFQGEYDRAEKQLRVLASASADAQMGAALYLSALHAERLRRDLFASKDYPPVPAEGGSRKGSVNGKEFESFEDSDPRIGARLELFAAGAYLWIPLAHVESIEIQPPARLRDLLWIPALVRTGPAFRGTELGEVLLPVLAPFSFKDPRRHSPPGPGHGLGGSRRPERAVRATDVLRRWRGHPDSGNPQGGVRAGARNGSPAGGVMPHALARRSSQPNSGR